ncbi:MAG: hypothetical protein CFE49_00095 [Pseudomonas sp. PGPPP3]|nr:MAG: hypothetical protein CFE49_00095 [Pseudomonas sp. PGPPP3]
MRLQLSKMPRLEAALRPMLMKMVVGWLAASKVAQETPLQRLVLHLEIWATASVSMASAHLRGVPLTYLRSRPMGNL